MKSILSFTRRVIDYVTSAVELISEIGLFVLLALVILEVVSRYVFRSPSQYSLELTTYLLVLLSFLAAPQVLRDGGHVRVDLIHSRLPQAAQRSVWKLINILGLLLCVILTWKGIDIAIQAYTGGYHSSSILRVPLFIPYSIIPLGSLILALRFLVSIFNKNAEMSQGKS